MYSIGQIFENIYPADCANWCNDNNCHLQQIDTVQDVIRFQIQQNTNTQDTITSNTTQLLSLIQQYLKPATGQTIGLVKPDNETLTITDGVLSLINNSTSSSGDWEFYNNFSAPGGWYLLNKNNNFIIQGLKAQFTSTEGKNIGTRSFTLLKPLSTQFFSQASGVSTGGSSAVVAVAVVQGSYLEVTYSQMANYTYTVQAFVVGSI